MDKVLTLIAAPAQPLDEATVSRVAAALAAETAPAVWLAAGTACDVQFTGIGLAEARDRAEAVLDGRLVDAIAQPAEGRRKKLLIADMDSTIVTGETLDDMAALAGIGEAVAAITRRAMNGEIDFAGALRERVAMLKDRPADLLERTLAMVELMPGARILTATMRAHGAHAMLVSGGFRFFTGRVREMAGFDRDEGNVLHVEDGLLTGTVGDPILGREHKLKTLTDAAAARGLSPAETLAVGDGANDLPMLLAAGLGVAYHAKPSVRAAAHARIDHGDLTALLYAQGYRAEEFATPEA